MWRVGSTGLRGSGSWFGTMSIAISCPSCAHAYHVNEKLAGKRVKCKGCGGVIVVPGKKGKTKRQGALSAAALVNDLARMENERVAAEMAAEAAAARKASTAKHAKEQPAAPESKSRYVYLGIALLCVGAFGMGVYYVGQYCGLWGETLVQRAVKRELTASEKVELNRTISARNLTAIGQALRIYADAHKGMYPARIQSVLEVAEISPEVFNSPFSEKGGYHYNHHRSMGTAMANQTVVAYDQAEFEGGEGGNVLYANGKVKWVAKDQLAGELEHSEKLRLGLAEDEERVAAKGHRNVIEDRKSPKRQRP